jgi:transcriptional regulator with GAF, ATPase, and Fis domain
MALSGSRRNRGHFGAKSRDTPGNRARRYQLDSLGHQRDSGCRPAVIDSGCMSARLMAVAGSHEGVTFPLPAGEFTIGRDGGNGLCVAADDRMSRRHAAIVEREQQFTICDLTERGRTYVNRQPVAEHVLAHGDEIWIGRSVFLFLIDGQPVPDMPTSVDLDEGTEVSGSHRSARKGDPLYLDRDTLLEQVPHDDRTDRVVQSVLAACQAVLSARALPDLQRRLISTILEATPAERAAILLLGDQAETFASALHWTRRGGACSSFRIPRAVIRHVLTESAALCINDASYTVWSSQTVMQAQLKSMIAVPLVESGLARGAIYVDLSNPGVRFGEHDLRLLTGIAEVSTGPLLNALEMERLERENQRLLTELSGKQPLIGNSERMREVHRFVMKVSASDATVLITGATGTGKELVARAIHRTSARAHRPFAAINCAAVTETLIESEFFGHEKGAFTGAYAQKKGKLEEADGGTVFLDEIGELAPALQSKLLRVLQEREFERVGGTKSIKVNVRVVAATNRDLREEIERGSFREDLFYRLNVVAIAMPALRDRREDIPLLATHFLQKYARTCARRITLIAPEAMACLMAYDWPGNVRELENAIERAIVLGTTEQILPDDLPESIVESLVEPSASSAKFHEMIREIKKQLVGRALKDARGSYAEAAKILGLHPNNLHRLMKTLGMKAPRSD